MSFPYKAAFLGILSLGVCACAPRATPGTGPAFRSRLGEEGPVWPRFHGPKGDNISAEKGLLKEWPKDGPGLLWTAKGIGAGFAGVTLAHGLIYTAGNLDGKTTITALDLDGKIQWQVPNGPAWTGDPAGSRGTPTIDGDRLYHESPLGEVVCLNAKTGDMVWGLNILKDFEGENITWALAESLLVHGDRVIVCPGGNKASVAALDKNTGKTVWTAKSTGGKAGYATPAQAEHEGLRMILAMNQNALVGVNADGGGLLFRHEHRTQYDVNATTPILRDGQIFITSGYGSGSEMLKLTVDGKKASVERVWESQELDNHHGGVVFLDGCIYGAAHNKHGGGWICLDWKTGKMMYAEKGVGKGSLTCADGMLYTYSENRKVGLVQATPDGHKLTSQFTIPKGGEGPTWAHPVVCGGTLYLRHGDLLFAYDVRGGK